MASAFMGYLFYMYNISWHSKAASFVITSYK